MVMRLSFLLWSLASVVVVVEGNKQFTTTQELMDAVDTYVGTDMDMVDAIKVAYGSPMNTWSVGLIQDFDELFSAERNPEINVYQFSANLDNWNTRNAKTMKKMFASALHFDGAISEWDVSSVTDMSSMFAGCEMFNRNLDNWDVSSVKHMEYMFANDPGQERFSFNTNIGTWDTSSVWSMKGMFRGSKSFNQDLNNWDTSSLTSTKAMFEQATVFNGDIGQWDVLKIQDMRDMFYGATSYTGKGLYQWQTQNVKEFNGMFANAKALTSIVDNTADVSTWDVSNAVNMEEMFMGAQQFNADVSKWDVGKVTAMGNMFKDAQQFEHDLCAWGYTIRNVREQKQTEELDLYDANAVVDVHGMFKNTSCAEHLDPIIDTKLSRGFCTKKCLKESAYKAEKAKYGNGEKIKGNAGRVFLYIILFFVVTVVILVVVRKVVYNPHRGMKELGSGNDANPSFFGADADPKGDSERGEQRTVI